MALIECPDCGSEVSERAPACPKCGGPIVERRNENPTGVQTIQATSKAWKAVQAVGIVLALGGVTTCAGIAQDPDASGHAVSLSSGAVMVGFIVFIVGRIGAWWNHE